MRYRYLPMRRIEKKKKVLRAIFKWICFLKQSDGIFLGEIMGLCFREASEFNAPLDYCRR
jgi:hypothetical protein